jgi:hypothetical protein
MRCADTVLVGTPERKTRVETPSCRWEDNFKMYIEKRGEGS